MARSVDPAGAVVAAGQALAGGDELGALDRLLDAWRASRAVEIGRVTETLSARLAAHLAPIGGKLDTFQPLWLAIAKRRRAVDLPRLLGSVLHTTDRFGVAVVDALVARGRALAAWPADPRSSAIIVTHLLAGGYESTSKSTHPFWSLMFQLLRTHADPRIAERLATIRFAKVFRTFSDGARRIAWFQAQLDEVVAALNARPAAPPLSGTVRARVTKLAAAIAARPAVSSAQRARLEVTPAVPAPAAKPRARPPVLDARASGPQVEAALRALASGDNPAALHALLAAWRVTRAPELADLVARVSRRCGARLPPIRGVDRAAIHATWLATCREHRPADLPRLLETVTLTYGRSTDALARVHALATWPSDPRTLAGVVGLLEQPAFHTSSTRPFWSALIGLAVDHLDPRLPASFDALAARYHRVLVARYTDLTSTITWFRNKLTAAAAEVRTRAGVPLALDAATAKTCERIAAALATEDALLAEVLEHPADDHAREVYADLLQERGDPRGEVIALQLAGRDPARVAELVANYAHAWLDALGPVIDLERSRFERGFLAEVTLGDLATADSLTPVIGHPLWATVTQLHLGRIEPLPHALLVHPVMRSLRYVTVEIGDGRRWVHLRTARKAQDQLVVGGAGAPVRTWRSGTVSAAGSPRRRPRPPAKPRGRSARR